MQNLRHAKTVARFVLVWFALALGVAIANPLVQPKSMQLVCTGSGAVKVLVEGDSGVAPSGHTLDCPLCMIAGAPPPADSIAFAVTPRPAQVGFAGVDAPLLFVLAAPPPARGPPALV